MGECICNSCRNLRGIVDENGEVIYDCKFGFPSKECSECETGDCNIVCNHFASDDEEEQPRLVKCSGCGKELKQSCGEGDGDIYCVDCFMSGK